MGDLFRQIFSCVLSILLLVTMVTLLFDVQPVEANGTIYIRAEGGIDPPTANIISTDNITYYFTNNNYDSIVIQRDNIVVDGAGYIVQGTKAHGSKGINLAERSNVTVRNMEIKFFSSGIFLNVTSDSMIIRNSITENDWAGIWVWESFDNIMIKNNITNNYYGIELHKSSYNNILENTIAMNKWYGIVLDGSSNNMSFNNVSGSIRCGIGLFSSNNTIRGNIMTSNWCNFEVGGGHLSDYINDVDISNLVDGKPIYFWINETNKITPLDAGCVILVNCTNITVENLTLKNNEPSILLVNTTNSTITQNTISDNELGVLLRESSNHNTIINNHVTNNFQGIFLYGSSDYNYIAENNVTANDGGILFWFSSNNNISSNNIKSNNRGIDSVNASHNNVNSNTITANDQGIRLQESSDNIISLNNITANKVDGIRLSYSSNYNSITENYVTANKDGVSLWISSNNNTITLNNIIGNSNGLVLVQGSVGNFIYHNNFINNSHHVLFFIFSGGGNIWDNGYPSSGNYWSDYTGVDFYSGPYQNITGNDGIGDTAYVIDEDNTDNYPLMGMFSDFNVTSEYQVQTICNSTISDFHFNGTAISFNVSGENGTTGFCRIRVPTALMNGAYKVFVNGMEVSHTLLPFSNSTHSYLYFNYTLSTKEIVIVPEFQSAVILLLAVVFITIPIIMVKKKLPKKTAIANNYIRAN